MLESLKRIVRSWVGPATPITSPAIGEVLGGITSGSGVPVNKMTALGIPALWRGIDLIASTLARIDCPVYKQGKDNTRQIDEDHQAHYLLNIRPNEYQTPFEFKRQIVSEALWNGNGYAAVIRDENGMPTDLILLDPEHTGPIVIVDKSSVGNVQCHYVTEIEGKLIPIPFSDVIHLKGLGTAGGFMGSRLLTVARETIGCGLAQIKFASVYFKHSCNPSILIKVPPHITDKEQIKDIVEKFDMLETGLNNAHRYLLLFAGLEAAPMKVSAEEAQLVESRQFQQIDFANLLGLPPHKLGANIATSYNSLEQENLALLSDTYDKWMVNCEQQFEQKLLTEVEKKRLSRTIRFERDKLLVADHKTTIENWIALVNNGLALPNDACSALHLNPLDDEFNEPRLPTNIGVQGEEAEQPQEVSQEQPQLEQPDSQQSSQEQPEEQPAAPAVKRMAEAVVKRLVVRLDKAGESAKGADWLEPHRAIFEESLPQEIVDEMFSEFSQVTRDKIAETNIDHWVRRILEC